MAEQKREDLKYGKWSEALNRKISSGSCKILVWQNRKMMVQDMPSMEGWW